MNSIAQLQTLYKGSVKDLLGPVQTPSGEPAVVFNYTDAYSVFDWGKMPDPLPSKGEALATLAADWFERLERPETWVEFSRSAEALRLRKASRFGALFNELGERLQKEGLRTHYLGSLESQDQGVLAKPLRDCKQPVKSLLVRQVSVVKPQMRQVMGRAVPDYLLTRQSPLPRLIPLEVVFRFSVPPGSSLASRLERDPTYLVERGFSDTSVQVGKSWDFPVLEMFTKLEESDRPVALTEALAIAGVSAELLQEVLFKTAWVAALLRAQCAERGLELADGKLEWAVDENGQSLLVDAIGPDELRILKGGVQLSKEFLRAHYRTSAWYLAVERSKEQAELEGVNDWKRFVRLSPAPLPADLKELGSQMYRALTNALTGKKWFPNAWSLEEVITRIEAMEERS